MKGTYLGEFEELVLLTVSVLHPDAYSISILDELKQRTGRAVLISSVHKVLMRLEDKGYLTSDHGKPSDQRGGRSKRLYEVTASGKEVLKETKEIRIGLWKDSPSLSQQNI